MRFDIVTIFPEMFHAVSKFGITGRALDRGLAQLHTHQLRDYAHDAYKTVDDRPYGGGPGMVMMPGPLTEAVAAVKTQQQAAGLAPGPVVLMSPAGQPMNQALMDRVATTPCWTIICGRYEGVDQRFIDQQVDELWSLGDFVLSGGEIAAMAVLDGAIRRLPGALRDAESAVQDSFSGGQLLDWPHYTRPEVFAGQAVPDVLLSGHHERIADWRKKAALAATEQLRPDLLEKPD
ncbi:tRNA (guanosine(37)-N1)-methyltransferase TrmD [beta proteobacterium MWH-UniP1]